jgi:AsmA-like C-terminal region/Domain of Unknown Function (DUF748)
MGISRKHLWLIAAVFAGASLFLIQSLNTKAAQSRQQLQQELQKWLGKDATFDRLEVSLWRGLGFSAREFRIADNPRFAATPLLRAKDLRLGLSLTQLLLGRMVVNSLTFHDPELQIITDEDGRLNLSALTLQKQELGSLPRWHTPRQERNHTAVHFLITKIAFRNGRVDFIDRSVKEPAELQVRNVEMDLKGLDRSAKTKIRFTAAVTEGLNHDVRIEGELGPIAEDRDWLQQPVDLEMQFDSLQVPLLTRALPILRNKIPRELDVAGPLALEARVGGHLGRPRITDITLKGLLFGSSDYNAVLTGEVDLSKSRAWPEAQLKGKFKLEPVNLMDLRRLPFLKPIWPAALVTKGPISIYSQFEGPWESLRIGTLIKADQSEIGYGAWLQKPAGASAVWRGRISRVKNGLIIHESPLTLGKSSMMLSGAVEAISEPRLQLRIRAERSPLAAWHRLVSHESLGSVNGMAGWDLVFDSTLPLIDGRWNLRGKMKLADAAFTHKESGKKIDQLHAELSFWGREARVDNASFRFGSSQIKLAATLPDLFQPAASYDIWSAELNPMDLPILLANFVTRVKNVRFVGEMQLDSSAPLVNGTLSSTDGNLMQLAYRDFRTDIAWSPKRVSFENLVLRSLNGTLRSNGSWAFNGERDQRLEIVSEITSMDAGALVKEKFPQLKNRIDGHLDFRGRFNATRDNGAAIPSIIRGSGGFAIQRGTIRDVNLIAMLLPRSSGVVAASNISSRLPPILTELIERQHTPFDTLKANFALEEQRLQIENLILVTPDYTITGAGSVGFNKATKWTGLFVLSPRVTQELQSEYKTIRHLLDRRGRLAIPFRADGPLSNIKIRPENRALAQALGARASDPGNEPAGEVETEHGKAGKRDWLPKSLEDLLKR